MIYYIIFGCFSVVLVFSVLIWRRLEKFIASGESAKEAAESLKENRIKEFKDILKSLKENQNRIENSVKIEFSNNRREQLEAARSLRQEITANMEEVLKNQQKHFKDFEERFVRMSEAHLQSQEKLKQVVESGLKSLQEDNEKQLEKMRVTVDEKLQGTLEKRLSESFGQVSEKLRQVYQGLGEMKTLAHGVGDLKKVLTNVKIRGTWGEFQLGNILEEILSPEQYEKNFSVKPASRELVEYAVKLPGQDRDSSVYLPIDSKFPQEDYQSLLTAQDHSDPEVLRSVSSKLEGTIKREARTIRDKYISPPRTTDFAIMFLPTEGLYAEILRRSGLVDYLQRECRVMVAGPTNLAALLNSLAVGFRTLAIQKRSSDVWKLLDTIKTQFGTFSGLLDNVQKKLDEASGVMEKASKRSRMIEKKLDRIEQPSEEEVKKIIP